MVHTHNGILLSDQKDKLTLFVATWIELEGITLSEGEGKEMPDSLTFMWNLEELNKGSDKGKQRQTLKSRK